MLQIIDHPNNDLLNNIRTSVRLSVDDSVLYRDLKSRCKMT